jgi:hypothetical protein
MGRLIAVAYLVCMLAPAAALAWGGGPAPCLADHLGHEAMLADLVPAHQHMQADHGHGTAHHHAVAQADQAGAAPDQSGAHPHEGKGKQGPCCAMMCVSAMPSDLPDISKPARPVSTCSPDLVARLHGETPPLLYRPPIA